MLARATQTTKWRLRKQLDLFSRQSQNRQANRYFRIQTQMGFLRENNTTRVEPRPLTNLPNRPPCCHLKTLPHCQYYPSPHLSHSTNTIFVASCALTFTPFKRLRCSSTPWSTAHGTPAPASTPNDLQARQSTATLGNFSSETTRHAADVRRIRNTITLATQRRANNSSERRYRFRSHLQRAIRREPKS